MTDDLIARLSELAGEDVVERVAIALHDYDHVDASQPWRDFSDLWKGIYRERARAALAALSRQGEGEGRE